MLLGLLILLGIITLIGSVFTATTNHKYTALLVLIVGGASEY